MARAAPRPAPARSRDRAGAGRRRRRPGLPEGPAPGLRRAAREQRRRVHGTANASNKLPRGSAGESQAKAKRHLQAIRRAGGRQAAEAAFDFVVEAAYGAKYDNKAVACLTTDREARLTFDAFPAEHWQPIRSTNPVESTFATVRLRPIKTGGGCLSRERPR